MCDILLVEDDEGVAKSLSTWLTAAYRTSTGNEIADSNPLVFSRAASLGELNAHRFDKHDCIILDLLLADATIPQTFDWLRDNARNIPPVIVITAMPDTGQKNTYEMPAFQNGALGFIHKEEVFTSEGIMRLLRRIFVVGAVYNYWNRKDTNAAIR
jgi:DNA-binding response OmpR family regulator